MRVTTNILTTIALLASTAIIGSSAIPARAEQSEAATTTTKVRTAEVRNIVGKLASLMEGNFVYPDIGKRYAAELRRRVTAGDYDGLSDTELAQRMTSDLLAIYPDGHVRIRAQDPRAGTQRGGSIAIRPEKLSDLIEDARWIAPGIAFVRFNAFMGTDKEITAARRFMEVHSGARTIIFDLRTHNGGGLEEMDVVLPWLFDKPTRLVSMATRRSVDEAGGFPLASSATLRLVDGDPAFVTHEHWVIPNSRQGLRKARVYLLTSGRTASAAEHFCLAMKSTGRATLVGTPTAGANHFGRDVVLGDGLTAFIPVGRTYDPRTGKDWEGTGVPPDIETAPEDALKKVLELEGLSPAEAERLSAQVAPTRSMERRKP